MRLIGIVGIVVAVVVAAIVVNVVAIVVMGTGCSLGQQTTDSACTAVVETGTVELVWEILSCGARHHVTLIEEPSPRTIRFQDQAQ